MLRGLVLLALIGSAAWWWWEPRVDRERASRARSSKSDDVSQIDQGAKNDELEGDPSGSTDADGWTPPGLSAAGVIDSDA